MPQFSEIDIDNFKRAFDLFDKDGSGSISRQQITQVFKSLKINLNQSQLCAIMQNFDANNDNSIQFDQFLLVISAHFEEPDCQQWIFQVFQILDQDCDGLVAREELVKVNQCYGLEIKQREIDLIMEEGDPAAEGGISYQEFSRILKLN